MDASEQPIVPKWTASNATFAALLKCIAAEMGRRPLQTNENSGWMISIMQWIAISLEARVMRERFGPSATLSIPTSQPMNSAEAPTVARGEDEHEEEEAEGGEDKEEGEKEEGEVRAPDQIDPIAFNRTNWRSSYEPPSPHTRISRPNSPTRSPRVEEKEVRVLNVNRSITGSPLVELNGPTEVSTAENKAPVTTENRSTTHTAVTQPDDATGASKAESEVRTPVQRRLSEGAQTIEPPGPDTSPRGRDSRPRGTLSDPPRPGQLPILTPSELRSHLEPAQQSKTD